MEQKLHKKRNIILTMQVEKVSITREEGIDELIYNNPIASHAKPDDSSVDTCNGADR